MSTPMNERTNEKLNVLMCVATKKGYEVLRAVHASSERFGLIVTTFRETRVVKSSDELIREYCEREGITTCDWAEVRDGGTSWVEENGIEAVVCIGWRYLVADEIRSAVDGNVFVAHDSLLPKYRGFAPLPSALIKGESEVGVTVLMAADGVDTGDVLDQSRTEVPEGATMADLIERVIPLYREGVCSVLRDFAEGALRPIPQDHAQATHSIWRDEEDLFLDWAESAERIERTIRALGPPYLGARTRLGSSMVVIRKARILDDIVFEIRQPGKVWSLTAEGEPVVVCGTGLLAISEAEIDGAPLIPLQRLRVRFH